MRRRSAFSIWLVLCSLASACDATGAGVSDARFVERARAALQTYAEIAGAAYADSARSARALAAAIDGLLAAPSAEALAGARRAWLQSRIPYAQTEAFRFYDGPIDAVERWVNSWPIDENYVESEASAERLGLIQDSARYPLLAGEVLARLNMRDGETSISTGYHVLEFLLWGRDQNPAGPGERPFSDFVEPPQSEHTAAATIARRRAYLRSAAGLLAQQLEQVAQAWNGSYRTQFLALPPAAAMGLAVKGMGSLSGPELAGERLSVAYETKDQENEHSCFSDSTLADLTGDALGLQNLCLGRYRRLDGSSIHGSGLCDALQLLAADPATRLKRQCAASLAAVRAIPAPFDRAILGSDSAPGRRAVAAAIQALRAQSDTLAELAALLQVGLTTSARTP
jgi:putative iron-regulated protein